MADYEGSNFNYRLKVETHYPNGVVKDHRENFTREQYFLNMQDKDKTDEEDTPAGTLR